MVCIEAKKTPKRMEEVAAPVSSSDKTLMRLLHPSEAIPLFGRVFLFVCALKSAVIIVGLEALEDNRGGCTHRSELSLVSFYQQ